MTPLEEEAAARVHRVIAPIARTVPGARVNFLGRGGVWDNPDGFVGVTVTMPKLMGKTQCEATASFTLDRDEQRCDESVRNKAVIAFSAITKVVLVRIRPISLGGEKPIDGAAA